jgi:hypothetical protein
MKAEEFIKTHFLEACATKIEGYIPNVAQHFYWVIEEQSGCRKTLGDGRYATESEAWKGAKKWLTKK